VKVRWHRYWLDRFRWKHRRAEHKIGYHNDALRLLEPFVPNTVAQAVEHWVEGTKGREGEVLDTSHLRLLVDDDLDLPDTPEADHLFWESSAEDHLGDDGTVIG
jgi:hypothetical protein